MWRSLTHRFVLPFLGIYELEDGTAPQFFLVSPYMTNGNLAQWRRKANPSVAEVEERVSYPPSALCRHSPSTEDTGSCPRHGIYPFRRRSSWRPPWGIYSEIHHVEMLTLLFR